MYKLLLWIHVMTAIALLGPTYLFPALARRRGSPPNVTILRVEMLISRYVRAFLVIALLSGGWLIGLSPFTSDGRFSDATWLHLGMTLFFTVAGIGTGYAMPRHRKALAAAERGDDAEAKRLLGEVDRVGPFLGILAAVIVYLMSVKPDF